MKNRNLKAQFEGGLQTHIEGISFPTDTQATSETDDIAADEVELVSFRELVPEIKDTGYLTHAIFAYPAKFIPQVVRYAINTYTKEGDWIVDPFAGSGTVGGRGVSVQAKRCATRSESALESHHAVEGLPRKRTIERGGFV